VIIWREVVEERVREEIIERWAVNAALENSAVDWDVEDDVMGAWVIDSGDVLGEHGRKESA
jgi:hypothetical protein